jgi:hypothetical protein
MAEKIDAYELKELEETFNKNAWELFEYIRSESKHEHSLLTGRVTWYITCQSFLLTIYVISYVNSKGSSWFSNLLLPFLAISITILAFFMIQGATETIEMWNKLRAELLKKRHKLNPILISRWHPHKSNDDFIHFSALWFPRFITFLFGAVWIVIAFASWTHPWIEKQMLVK